MTLPNLRLAVAVAAVVGLAIPAAALDLVKGYERDAGLANQLGDAFLFDQAATGGGDASIQVAPASFGWAAEYANLWDIGTPVSLTGLALPLQSNTGAGNNTTQNGDLTFTFFDLGGGDNPDAFDGYNFDTMTGESILGSVTATFSNYGLNGVANQTDEYFVKFDTPLDFTAASTGLAFHIQSTNTLRVKVNNPGPLRRPTRVGLDGTRLSGNNSSFAATLAGTPVVFDPPPPPPLGHRVVASLDAPGDRRLDTLEPSVERYQFSLSQPGDYNGDGLTNAADYTVYRDNLGGDADLAFAAGSRDLGNAGVVNAADLTHWEANYGSPAIVAVDDPSVPGITTSFSSGAIGQANVYQNTAVDGTLASRQDGSFEIWFKPDDLAGGDQVIYEVGGTGNGMVIALQDDQLSFHVRGPFSGNEQTLTTTLTDADWTQVVAVVHNTFEASLPSADDYIELYLDGVLVESNELTPTDINRWSGGNQAGLGQEGGNFASTGPLGADISAETEFALNGEIAIFEYAATAWDSSEVASRYSAITSTGGAAVPEPTTLAMLTLSAAAVWQRRK